MTIQCWNVLQWISGKYELIKIGENKTQWVKGTENSLLRENKKNVFIEYENWFIWAPIKPASAGKEYPNKLSDTGTDHKHNLKQ